MSRNTTPTDDDGGLPAEDPKPPPVKKARKYVKKSTKPPSDDNPLAQEFGSDDDDTPPPPAHDEVGGVENDPQTEEEAIPENVCMELRTCQATAWKVLAESLKDLVNDCNIEFNPSGVKLATMDSAHISLCSLNIDGSKLDKYYCNREYVIGVSTINLHKLLKGVGTADTLTLRLRQNDLDRLQIITENSERQSRTVANMKLLDLDVEKLEVPEKDFDICVTMLSVDLSRMCREMSQISDNLRIRSDKSTKGLILSAEGDIGEVTQFVAASDSSLNMSHNSETEIDSEFALKYLVMFTRCAALCNCVSVFLQPNFPMMMKYDVGTYGELIFALAPKVGSEHDEEGEGGMKEEEA